MNWIWIEFDEWCNVQIIRESVCLLIDVTRNRIEEVDGSEWVECGNNHDCSSKYCWDIQNTFRVIVGQFQEEWWNEWKNERECQ